MRTLRIITAALVLGLFWHTGAFAKEGAFVGVDLGVSEPTKGNYRGHVHTGGTAAPYFGYMYNDWLGLQGQVHVTFQEPDDDNRGIPRENETTTLLGGTFGPRVALPLGDLLELYGTAQGGYFTGLSGRLRDSGGGFSGGAGMNLSLTDNLSLGIFGRWNFANIQPRPYDLGPTQKPSQRYAKDIEWVTAGGALHYAFGAPEEPPPPPPAPVAKPAPPPPAPIVVKKQIVLRSVNFDFDKATLRQDALPVLDEAVETLKEAGDVTVVVEGHTDSTGPEAYNQGLSERRAQSVRDYLVKGGINAARITAQGMGESDPVASNETRDGRAQNRRVELNVK